MKNKANLHTRLNGLAPAQRHIGRLLGMGPSLHNFSPLTNRRIFAGFDRLLGIRKQAIYKVTDFTFPLRGDNGHSTLRAYYPNNTATDAIVFFHGGGCVIGSVDTHDRFCRLVANESQTIVLSVEYRLAPEHPFPAQLEDASASWDFIVTNQQRLGVNASTMGAGGDSAGAYLATSLCLSQEEKSKPHFLWLLYPMADLRADDAYQRYTSNLILTRDTVEYFKGHFLPAPSCASRPDVSLVLSPYLAQCPKTCIYTVEFDPLLGGGLAMVKKLREQGVSVSHYHLNDCFHGLLSVAGVSKRAYHACLEMVHSLKSIKA
ncbi:alpha/beta hydrolase [Alteromonas sediminis]|uniref:Alpha/beta hydrolase n=1 Tax=Alteromonas sediminis TaxID=2259342 RepID=A0A3N5Y221_9ALTE|nr:alpha/beta hydrolase [Alteromonas sediminis]RPJ66686.1 alpha/beta hydrolase [Alteromonas sediminis]